MRFASNSPVAFTVEFSTIEHRTGRGVARQSDKDRCSSVTKQLARSIRAVLWRFVLGYGCLFVVVFLWSSLYGRLWLSFYGGLNSKKANDDYTYKKKLIAIWSAIKAR